MMESSYGEHLINSINFILDDGESEVVIQHVPNNETPNWPIVKPRYIKGHNLIIGNTTYEKWSTVETDEQIFYPQILHQPTPPSPPRRKNTYLQNLTEAPANQMHLILFQQLILQNLNILNANLRNSVMVNERDLLNKNIQNVMQNNVHNFMVWSQWTNYLKSISNFGHFRNNNFNF